MVLYAAGKGCNILFILRIIAAEEFSNYNRISDYAWPVECHELGNIQYATNLLL
jgi:hypothetical protein